MDDNLMDLGTKFRINLRRLSHNAAKFTIEQLIAALEASTTLTSLDVCHFRYTPTPENIRRVIEPLCRCISNLRLHNPQHPLRQLGLWNVNMVGSGMQNGVYAQFLVAAKQFGIFHMKFVCLYNIPIQVLVVFCRDNNSLKVLDLSYVTFSSGPAAMSLPLNNGPPNDSVILTLDKLTLRDLQFDDSTAATVFADLVAHVNASSLMLGDITARIIDDEEEEEEEDDDNQITVRILSELKMPSSLDDGTTTVTHLTVSIDFGEDDVAARVELLASFIRRSVKLNSLTLRRVHSNRPQSSLPPHLFQALEACATVTYIEVNRVNHQHDVVPDVCPDEVRQLQKITSRNRELDRFATNSGTYPTEDLPELMRQCDNCPTGCYMLARRLPGVFSFDELRARIHRQKRNKQRSRNADEDFGAITLKKGKHSSKGPAL